MGQKESVDEARGSATTHSHKGGQAGRKRSGVLVLARGLEMRALKLSGSHWKDGGGLIEGGQWPDYKE